MIAWKSAVCLLAAVSLCVMAGCSDSDSDTDTDSVSDSSQSDSEDADSDDSEEQTESDEESEAEEYSAGDKLTAAAELFSGDYTYTASVSYSDDESTVTEVTLVSYGDKVYQKAVSSGSEGLQTNAVYLFDGSTAYAADLNLGVYSQTDERENLNTVLSVIDAELENTATRILNDEAYTYEEYTYTGSTYMSVFDFYFGEDDSLEKYTVTYLRETEDDLVETVEIGSIEQSVDESVFDSALEGLESFDDFTEDERLGFCQNICSEYSVSTDDMYTLDITTDDFKTISFDDFTTLIYTFA